MAPHLRGGEGPLFTLPFLGTAANQTAAAAARMLLNLIAEPDSGPHETIVETNLVVRSSVGVPAKERRVA